MLKLKNIIGWVFVFFAMAGFCRTFSQTVGTTTADPLKITSGARPAGMAGVYTAMGDDAYSVQYNPAGLSNMKASQLLITHLDSLAQIQYEYLTFASAVGFETAAAVNFMYRHMPPVDNQNGNAPVNADDFLGSMTFATKVSPQFRLGGTLKYIQSDLASYSSGAVGFDIGGTVEKLPYGIKAGLALQNIGTSMKFNPNSTADPLPMFIRMGVGIHQDLGNQKDMNLAFEVFKPSDQGMKMGIGAEVWVFPKLFAVRGGYRFETFGKFTGNVFENYSLGCSLTRSIDDNDFSIDIAYDPADFQTTSQDTFFFGLNLRFNQFRVF